MSDEIPIPPSPIAPVAQQPAEARPGLRAPIPMATSEEWERISRQLLDADRAIAEARYLFRVARWPRADPAWRALRDQLREIRPKLEAIGDEAVGRLTEVIYFLGMRK